MCDYSLHLEMSRPARVGEKLVSTRFASSATHGFTAIGEPNVAICLLPGTEVAFETMDGVQDLKVPAGTQSGDIVRLRGLGVPHVRGRGRCDLRIRYVVRTPTDLSDEEDELYRRLAELRQDPVNAPRNGVVGRIREAFK